MRSVSIKPFWRFYGGKFRAAPRYPQPAYRTIVEPFAGAAGYSTRYYWHNVILIEKDPTIAELWRYLISSTRQDILSLPLVEILDDLPSWVPLGARHLIGFSFNDATVQPSKKLSSGRKKLATMGRKFEGWNEAKRNRIADQIDLISHWKIIEGSYDDIGNVLATWFIDPPYNNKAGRLYKCNQIDYHYLSSWTRARYGQVICCENFGADWLPFIPLWESKKTGQGFGSGGGKAEAIFHTYNARKR